MSPADLAAAETASIAPVRELQEWASAVGAALAAADPDRVADLFATDCYWRDLIAFAWIIRTFEGRVCRPRSIPTDEEMHSEAS